ncbi:unnamed protein product (macronuclear) [Paramecium tetraurelia]|uniref:Ras-related protein Rab-21 n=1 Tax=Paramecium tetraurelia TaxID=5888 RepID=Q3SDI1_PARTE|nr:uncharacterized protein GSPATT00039604001 [Paramecium tetraurelia]CAI39377.1 rab_A76 [Paramecium tetraurelia]CAK83972.1 unnamed protein product [Paramecium tetraurelia]|eukprot:XP_001451369.1 hypothetical protein (macronuclear) [Paramecium tetraurelia strain d4-2]
MIKQKSTGRSYKVVFLGENKVGKTSIITRYFYNTFSEKTEVTVCDFCKYKTIQTKNGSIELAVWDTAGQEKYHALAPIYYRKADAAIIVYNITVQQTFQNVRLWIQELQQFSQNANIIPVIVGNKDDLHMHRAVEQSQVDELCNQYNAKHFQVSAKSDKGITEIFDYIADGKQTYVRLELIKSVKQPNETTNFQEGNKKQTQKEGGRYC